MKNQLNIFSNRKRLAILFFFVVLSIFSLISFAVPSLERYLFVRAGLNQSATLRLAVEGLRLTLERYAQIPSLIAARPEIRAVFIEPKNSRFKEDARELLSETAVALRASGVYLEALNGRTIIAVPSILDNSDLTSSATYRPYFSQAVAGGIGQYYALGTQSGERGFFYAAPVRTDARISGVLTVKFAVDQFEAAWREGRAEIIVRDANDIIFMSSNPEWNFRAMAELSEERIRLIEAAKQFPIDQLVELPNKTKKLTNQFSLITIKDEGYEQEFVSSTSLIARAGWRITILTPIDDALAVARIISVSFVLLFALAIVLGLLFWQRRLRLAQQMLAQRAAQEMLERRVTERTEDLNIANSQLIVEVEERKFTEQQLRKTQTDLIQAGKLAGLGQMSAALSHELNQPLAAVKAYAENAATFIERGMDDEACDNVRQISSLADRMSSIAKHLRNFARRPQDKTKSVMLLTIVDDAIAIMNVRLEEEGVEVKFDRPLMDVFVNGGQVRLQQVVVNLISNAMDAMTGQINPQIDITIEQDGNNTHLLVRDYGSGLDGRQIASLFDPFYTTKSPGKGLGLGLSISYNIVRDFGGNLSVTNHDGGGALFCVTLQTTDISLTNEVAE